MILVDANILVYAFAEDVPQHRAAHTWLQTALGGRDPVGLPWESTLAFVRLVSNPRVFTSPVTPGEAWDVVTGWLDAGPAWVPLPTERHRSVLSELLPAVTNADLVPDAHLAALALEHGLTLVTSDRGFARFQGLRRLDPLRD